MGVLLLCCSALAAAVLVLASRLGEARDKLRSASLLARRRATRICEAMRTIRMVEDIAGVGVWEYDPQSGVQLWSTGMRKLFGVDHDDDFVEGDAETLLRANDIDLVGAISHHSCAEEPFTLQFDAYGLDGKRRSLRVEACNLRIRNGQTRTVVAVVRDVSEQIARERELEDSREAAMIEASQARELAATDPLTGLANRRRVMERLDRMVLDSRQTGCPLSLVVFDIDHFKSVNDTHGHLEGDKVLKNIARIAMSQSREADLVGRVGGEEFVWAVPNAGEAIVAQLAERLRAAVASDSATEIVPAVTMSVGYAELLPEDTTLTLFARADSALYEAKNSGRNQVRMAA